MHALMKQSNCGIQRKVYKGFYAAYALAASYSMLDILSHGMIGINNSLEESLNVLFTTCLTTFIIGTGLSAAVGPWTLIPVFVAVLFDLIGIRDNMYGCAYHHVGDAGKWAGRLLAAFTIYEHFKGFSVTFGILISCVGAVVPILTIVYNALNIEHDSDTSHVISAFVLDLIFGAMVYMLNNKVKAGEKVKVIKN